MSILWEKIARRAMFALDAERAHEIGIRTLEHGLVPQFNREVVVRPVNLFGISFPNPVGIAAGFDKNGRVVNQLAGLGFGFVEVGTVTFEPQVGNPAPRMFRLPEDEALINRLGFNNEGAAVVAERLRKLKRMCVVGVNIGKNKDVSNDEAADNYLKSFDLLHPHADYVAINISSPNTPNLRELQRADSLTEIVTRLQSRKSGKPLLVKIAPDLSVGEIEAIVDSCLSNEVDGVIATNTTLSRDGLTGGSSEAGGLSGRPLCQRSTDVIAAIYRLSVGRLPIIGVGGIFTAEDAFEKIAAGASLVQAYTGFVYGGPRFATRINSGLTEILARRGFSSIGEAVGSAQPGSPGD